MHFLYILYKPFGVDRQTRLKIFSQTKILRILFQNLREPFPVGSQMSVIKLFQRKIPGTAQQQQIENFPVLLIDLFQFPVVPNRVQIPYSVIMGTDTFHCIPGSVLPRDLIDQMVEGIIQFKKGSIRSSSRF